MILTGYPLVIYELYHVTHYVLLAGLINIIGLFTVHTETYILLLVYVFWC